LCGGRAAVCPDIANDGEHTEDWRQLCLDHGVRACHVEPVIDAQGQPVAVFMLCFDQPRKADEWESRRAQFGASVASVAIERDESQRALRASQQQLHHYQQHLNESQANLKKSQQRLQQLNKSLEQRVEERTVELERTSARLRHLAKELTSAEIRERKRVATILHDDLQQLLVSARIQLGRSQGRVSDDTAVAAIEQAQSRLDQAVASSRDLTRELRPPVLYEDGLGSALQWLAGETERRYNMRVIVDGGHADAGFDDDLNALLFESVRELLFNASKYAGVDVAMLEVCQDDDHLILQVRDTGAGFEPAPDYESATGSGFGLFSIRERLTALGGGVSVRSQPGEGTTIELRVPKASAGDEETPAGEGDDAEPGGEAAPVTEEQAAATAPATRQVVVVDDHAMVREGIASVLADDGRVTVTGEAGDGTEALDQLAQQQPDAVLVDVNMPHMNGVETTREIRRRWPQVVPIGLSVQNDASTASLMREAGAADFVAKYGASEDLIGKILELTGGADVGPPRTAT
jgi:signal transduction histidine kinase/ActR/RegA family two-component response regulator